MANRSKSKTAYNWPASEIVEAWLVVTAQALAFHLIQWLQLVVLEREMVYQL
jgi:hypothetical protein